MRNDKTRDIIDKLLDTFDKAVEKHGLRVYENVTYISKKRIAERLGCSYSTVTKLIETGRLLYYLIPSPRGYMRIATNETMIRMTFVAWWRAALEYKREIRTKP